jgi:PAS domain S-box-containing protein
MKASTALCFLLAAVSLWLSQEREGQPDERLRHKLARIAAAVVAALALLTLSEYVFGWDLGIDQLLFKETPGTVQTSAPGRMALPDSVVFLLLGAALLLLDEKSRRVQLAVQFSVVGSILISYVGVLEYIYSVTSLHHLDFSTRMALPTGLTFFVLGFGLLFARLEREPMAALIRGASMHHMWPLFPTAILIPGILGWLRLQGQRTGLYSTEFGLAMMVGGSTVIFLGLIHWTVYSLNRLEEKRERAQQALRQSAAALSSLVDNAPYGIYRSSVESGRFISVNPALVRMLGYSSTEEVLALDLARDVYRTAENRAQAIQALDTQGQFRDTELQWKRKDGADLVIRSSGRLVRYEGGEDYFEVIAKDITEQRKLEQQFRQAQKMEAVGQLAGGVAHDFNNLLMAISGFTELAGDAEPPNQKQQHYLNEVLKATRRAAGLTQQLLAFSRKQILAPVVLDLNVVVSDLGKMLPPLIGEHIEVRLLAKSQNSKVEADRGQLEQILMNLAVNARDAMPKGGTLVIEVADAVFEQDHADANYTIPAGSYVLLAVSDNGAGIARNTLEHIFEPFFTTKEKGKGTGLGLATVYGIVKQSSGYISAYSEPGVGTTFKIYLPRAEKPAATPAAQPEAPAAGGSETILLAEDESSVRIATRAFLETRGYKVLDAATAADAIQAHSQRVGKVHLLITDVVMPGMSGPDLAERLKQLDPAMQVIYVSGYTDGAIASVAGLQHGAGFLQKPFALDFLARKVRTVLDAAAQGPAASDPKGGAQ